MHPPGTQDKTVGQVPYSAKIQIGRFVVRIEADDLRMIHAILGSADGGLAQGDGPGAVTDRFIHLVLRLSSRPDARSIDIPPSEKAASVFENLELHASGRTRLLVIDRKSVVSVDPTGLEAVGYISPEHRQSAWILAHRIFYLSVIELLRCHRAYYIHAGCVCYGGNAILVCGPSGGGKSTLTYALARAGFSYLSDDGVFVHRNSQGLEVFSFPEKLKLSNASLSFFGELSHFRGGPGKCELSLKNTRVRHVSTCAHPGVLVFPTRSGRSTSEIHPIPKHDALLRVLEQSILLLRPMDVERQLELLTELVETCGCFGLSAACDFDRIPNLIADTVAGPLGVSNGP